MSTVGRPLPFARRPGERWSRFATRIANAFGLVLLLVLATYVLLSLIPYSGWPGVLIVLTGSASGVVGLVSAGARPTIVRGGTIFGLGALALAIVARLAEASLPLAIAGLIVGLLFAVAVGEILGTVLREPEVDLAAILGAISVYVILGLLFMFVYAAVDRLQSGPFFGAKTETGDFVWFSITTLTTTGYGNLVPAAQPGKMLSGLEMLTGQIFLVTLIAGLVSLWRPGTLRRP